MTHAELSPDARLPDRSPDSPSPLARAGERPQAWPYDELLGPRPGLLVVLSGPSGVGKDALIAALQHRGTPLTKVVTATTRPMRPGEVNGRDYHFLRPEEFARWRDEGKLLEWAEVYGPSYGTPVDEVRQALARGETVLLKIDVQGAAQVKQRAPSAVFIFLGPGSFDELVQRLAGRQTETPAAFQRRIEQAREELRQLPAYDYLVVNRTGALEHAVAQVEAILAAERLRVHPRPIPLP
jgi:guanylate kinase